MAYVRITGEFKDRVTRKINRMRDKELEQYQVDEIKDGSDLADAVADLVVIGAWGQHLDLKDKMPNKWCMTGMGHTTVEFYAADGTRSHRASMDLDNLKFPPNTSRYSFSSKIQIADCGKVITDWLAGVATAEANIKATREKFETIRNQIRNFLNGHTSLNTAIKALPELEMYIHSDDMERLRRKVVKSAPSPSEMEEQDDSIGVDADLLASVGVAARIKGVQ